MEFEAAQRNRSKTAAGAAANAGAETGLVVGAALVGGALVFLCCTRRGREMVSRAGAWLDEIRAQAGEVQTSVDKALATLEEGQRALRRVASRDR